MYPAAKAYVVVSDHLRRPDVSSCQGLRRGQ